MPTATSKPSIAATLGSSPGMIRIVVVLLLSLCLPVAAVLVAVWDWWLVGVVNHTLGVLFATSWRRCFTVVTLPTITLCRDWGQWLSFSTLLGGGYCVNPHNGLIKGLPPTSSSPLTRSH